MYIHMSPFVTKKSQALKRVGPITEILHCSNMLQPCIAVPKPLSNDLLIILFQKVDAEHVK